MTDAAKQRAAQKAARFSELLFDAAEESAQRTGISIERAYLSVLTGIVSYLVLRDGCDIDSLFSSLERRAK